MRWSGNALEGGRQACGAELLTDDKAALGELLDGDTGGGSRRSTRFRGTRRQLGLKAGRGAPRRNA